MASTTTPRIARIQPMWADIPATPPNPRRAATSAMMKNVMAQLSMWVSSPSLAEQPACHGLGAAATHLDGGRQAEKCAQPGDQQPGLEGLRDEVVEPEVHAAIAALGVCEARHRDRGQATARPRPHDTDELVPVRVGHA